MGIADALLPNPARVSTRPAKYKLFFLKKYTSGRRAEKGISGHRFVCSLQEAESSPT